MKEKANERILFGAHIGEHGVDKEQIRARAREIGLHVAEKKDSQDICFVEQGKYIEFIEK